MCIYIYILGLYMCIYIYIYIYICLFGAEWWTFCPRAPSSPRGAPSLRGAARLGRLRLEDGLDFNQG